MERIWDYGDEGDSESIASHNSMWGVDTADPIQVTPKLVVVVEVVNPQKAVYGVKYFHEAINKEILVAWKNAVQKFYYFSYEKDKESEEKGKVPEGKTRLQTSVQAELDKLLGFVSGDVRIEHGRDYDEKTPVGIIYKDYGIWLKRVSIRDIDPTDDEMRKALQEKFKARTAAASEIEIAKGKKESKIIQADGKTYEIRELGKANAGAERAMYFAKGDGMKKMSKDLRLKPEDAPIILATETVNETLKNADYTYLSGQPGDIASMAMAAVDRLKGSKDQLSKDKTGSKPNVGNMKKLWDDLTDEQKAEITQLSSGGSE